MWLSLLKSSLGGMVSYTASATIKLCIQVSTEVQFITVSEAAGVHPTNVVPFCWKFASYPKKIQMTHYIPRIASSMNFILPLVCCRWTHQLQCQRQVRSRSSCEAWDLGVEKSKASSHAWSGQTTICAWLVHLLYMVISMDWFKGRLKPETLILVIFPQDFPLNKSIDHFQKVLYVDHLGDMAGIGLKSWCDIMCGIMKAYSNMSLMLLYEGGGPMMFLGF